jgi:hypothetical protein
MSDGARIWNFVIPNNSNYEVAVSDNKRRNGKNVPAAAGRGVTTNLKL